MAIVQIPAASYIDSNIWLITGNENILIDTGTGISPDGLDYASFMARFIDPHLVGGLSKIILTHCHIDHVGGASSLSDHYGCPVFIGSGDAPFVRSADPDVTVSRMFGIPLEPIECQEVGQGHIFDTGEHRLRVIDTPGHTPGGICLYDEVTGALFSGDTVFASGIGRTDLPGGSFRALTESIVKLSNINIKTVYPGHGPVGADGPKTIDDALGMVGYR